MSSLTTAFVGAALSTTITERTAVIKDRSNPKIWTGESASDLLTPAEADAAERITVTVRIEKAKSPGERLYDLHWAHRNRLGVGEYSGTMPRAKTPWVRVAEAFQAVWEADAQAVGFK